MSENNTRFGVREIERDAYCRDCDELIPRGTKAVAGYSYRNRGMLMLFHIDCVRNINRMIDEEIGEVDE